MRSNDNGHHHPRHNHPGPGATPGPVGADRATPAPVTYHLPGAYQPVSAFTFAYALSEMVEAGVKSGRAHYRDRAGRLMSWGEVMAALASGELEGER